MTINLRTGEQYAPRREDYCTKISPVAAQGDCPLRHAFLARVTGGDGELKSYLARVCGYWLTGHTHEHALFFLFGTGANGKSVFIETVQGYMGDYATTAPIETFMAAGASTIRPSLQRCAGRALSWLQKPRPGGIGTRAASSR